MFKIHKKLKKIITFSEKRIAEKVRKYPRLYNTSLKDYKDARMTANLLRAKQRRFLTYKDATKQLVSSTKERFSTYCSGGELFSAPPAF